MPTPGPGIAGSRGASDHTSEFGRQQTLLKTGALQDAIFNSANFSSIATDDKGVIQIFNVGAERMLGYAAAEVVNRITPADISDPLEVIARAEALSLELGTAIRPGFEALVFKASRGIEDIYELTYFRKDGSRFPAMVSVTALRDAHEAIIGYLLIGTDNTARKQVEANQALLDQRLQEKNIELEHASRMKSEFLATMSHELRTPLNAIIGFSEALKDGLMGKLSDLQSEYIGDIYTSGQHLLDLINDILDLSKVEAGMMALELEPVDLRSLLAASLTIVKEKAAAQRVRLELLPGEEWETLLLDIRKTKQIIYNLLSNAVKFSHGGAQVTLSAHRVPRASVGVMDGTWPAHGFPLADSDYGEFIELRVCDSGIGISSADMMKLFEAFSQIDSSLARKFEGTGLGLAMVKKLAQLHGGTAALASAEGEGTRFSVWLPLLEAQGPAQPPVPRPPAVTAPSRVALVIEDDDKAADLVSLLLRADGFAVIRAAGAEAALLLAQRHDLSLITLDLQLPDMDGWEFLSRIRQTDRLAHVPVLVISAQGDASMAVGRGAALVLQKPISRAQLKAGMAELHIEPGNGRPCTVLVVDDDVKAIEVIAAYLPAPAYAVVRATGGREAIELAQRLKPDLILLDLMMPGVSGFDVVDALQNSPATAAIPVLVVTARQVTDMDRAALNCHAGQRLQIIEKSGFNSQRFAAEVRRALLPA